MTTSLKEQEANALNALALAQRALDNVHNEAGRRKAEEELLVAAEALDLVQAAIRNAQPYLGRFVKCATCRNVFNDEGSYRAHWRYERGRIRCVFTPSILKVMGFVADEHRFSENAEPEYVLQHPSYAA